MKTYYILWTYIGNYSEKPMKIQAENAEHAMKAAIGLYSEDFQKKATVYVFEQAPVLTVRRGETE